MSKLLRELTGLGAGNDVVLKRILWIQRTFEDRLGHHSDESFEKRMLVDCDKLRKTFHDVYDGKV